MFLALLWYFSLCDDGKKDLSVHILDDDQIESILSKNSHLIKTKTDDNTLNNENTNEHPEGNTSLKHTYIEVFKIFIIFLAVFIPLVLFVLWEVCSFDFF